jgi:hypothetical protein
MTTMQVKLPNFSHFSRIGLFKVFPVAISLLVLSLCSGSSYSYAQSGPSVREFQGDFVTEDGCPIVCNSIRTALDLDPFGVPIDGRIYISYKNVSDKQIDAVKFRIRFVDETGTDLGTFQAADGALVAPGTDHDQKWKREQINQKVTGMKVRVLQVKCPDGSMWQSSKMTEVGQPSQTAPGADGQQAPAASQ